MSDPQVLIEARVLARLPASDVLVVDCRFVLTDPPAGDAAFDAAHIPGAVHASLDRDLSDLSRRGLGRHPLPDAAAFAHTLARWGWEPRLQVVVYDDAGGAMAAARLWWMLGSVGITARVLDGGWQAWTAAGLPVAHGAAVRATSAVPALRFAAARMVDYAELDALRDRPDALIVDARGAPRFRGEVEPIDRVAGHVPGARNRPVAGNLTADGYFKSAASLRAEFAPLLAGRDPHRVVHMCGSGVFACQNQLAMEIAGLHGSRVFVPSWSGWSSDPVRPVATGD
ncbi:MAG TPA: rhodanese-like domain-containing protein [Rhodanobacteraceae bacterium]|nr:rhodanese-like domain-containing protein [Rhodanobacteraceae bacterium]